MLKKPVLMIFAAVIFTVAGCAGQPHAERSHASPSESRPAPAASRSSLHPGCSEAAVLRTWSLERRAAQITVAPAQVDNVPAAESLAAQGVGGILLSGSSAPPALPAELASLRGSAPGGVPPLVMTDEEGGEIQPVANLVGNLPWPRTMAATMTVAQVRALAAQTGRRMRAAGITMDLAPVLDLSDSPGPDAVYPDGPRSFSVNADVATAYGIAFAQGLQDGGVIPVVKHFPGLGQATYNTDFGPAIDPPLPDLYAGSLRPFTAAIAADLPAIMVSDVSIPGLTGGVPAALAPSATALLRQQLRFQGLVITDSLSAVAVQDAGYSVGQAAARAIEAGADMVLFNGADPGGMTSGAIASIASAVTSGSLSATRLDDAVQHVLAAKHVTLCP